MESDLDRWDRTNNVLGEIFEEREKQFEKWGDQQLQWADPENPTGIYLLGRTYAAYEQMTKARCDSYRDRYLNGERPDPRNNATVLLEEVFEALAAKDPEEIRAELIQVAAVAVKAIETLDRGHGFPPSGPPVIDDVSPRFTDVFLPGDGSVIVNDTIRVTPEEIDANYAKDLVEDAPKISLRVEDDQLPTEAQVRHAECVINDPGATVDQVAAADALLRHAEDRGMVPAHPVMEARHEHTYDRLHGLCRCGEARPDRVDNLPGMGHDEGS